MRRLIQRATYLKFCSKQKPCSTKESFWRMSGLRVPTEDATMAWIRLHITMDELSLRLTRKVTMCSVRISVLCKMRATDGLE